VNGGMNRIILNAEEIVKKLRERFEVDVDLWHWKGK
jgi:hypothetical protein